MNLGIYFNQEELEFISRQGKGYVRRLVQSEMSLEEDNKNHTKHVEAHIRFSKPRDIATLDKPRDIEKPREIKKVNKKKFKESSNIQSGNICNKCGFVLVAGKCINKGCKKK